jgi:hypothetical protein
VSERPVPDPAEPQPIPDEAGDAYVAHATPEVGTARNRRLLLLGVAPLVAVCIAIAIWILTTR